MARFQHVLYAASLLVGLTLSAGLSAGCGDSAQPDAVKKVNNAAGAKAKGPAGGAAGAKAKGPAGGGGPGGAGPGPGQANKGKGGGMPGDPAAGSGPGSPSNGGAATKSGPGEPGGLDSLDRPSFAKLIGDGDSINILVTIVGANEAQIDFQTLEKNDGNVAPRVLHVERVSGPGPHKIAAPANFDGDVYVSVMSVDEPTGQKAVGIPRDDPGAIPEDGPIDRAGGLKKPIKLAGADHSVRVTVGTVPAWLNELISPLNVAGGPLDPTQGGPGAGPPGEGGGPPPQ